MGEPGELAKKIARGHASHKHWLNLSEDVLARRIQAAFDGFVRTYPPNPTSGRKIYQASDGFTVVFNPEDPDGGTAFMPDGNPLDYYRIFVRKYQ